MNTYIDWNSKLPLHTSYTETAEALLFMHEHFRIKRVCFMQDYDERINSVAAFRIRREKALKDLSEILPSSLKISYHAAVHLTKELSSCAELHRLTITKQKLLPLLLPMESYADWIDLELNRLLYKNRISPLFLSFELYPILYPEEALQRLLRIPNAAYQFNYRAFTVPSQARMISSLLQRGATVLLGTGCTSAQKVFCYEFEHYLALAKESLTASEYTTLLKNAKLPLK